MPIYARARTHIPIHTRARTHTCLFAQVHARTYLFHARTHAYTRTCTHALTVRNPIPGQPWKAGK